MFAETEYQVHNPDFPKSRLTLAKNRDRFPSYPPDGYRNFRRKNLGKWGLNMGMTTEQIRALVEVLHSYAERFAGMANEISQNRLISPHEREWFDGAAHGMESAAAAIEVAWLHTDNDEKTYAEVWNEGCTAGEQYYKRTVIGVPGLSPIPAPVNPY